MIPRLNLSQMLFKAPGQSDVVICLLKIKMPSLVDFGSRLQFCLIVVLTLIKCQKRKINVIEFRGVRSNETNNQGLLCSEESKYLARQLAPLEVDPYEKNV